MEAGRRRPPCQHFLNYYYAKEMRLLAYTVATCDVIVYFLACRVPVKFIQSSA